MPVVCGTSDSAAEDYGAGAVEPGDLIIKLATAGNVNAMTAAPHPHPKTLTYAHVVPGMWYSVSATNAAALCQRWMRDTFYLPVRPEDRTVKSPAAQAVSGPSALSGASPMSQLSRAAALSPGGALTAAGVYAAMDAEAATSPVGAGGVMFHPYLQGERCPYWDANLRASFTGVSISSTRGDFCRALLEGVAFSLRDCFGTLEEMGLPAKRIFLIGGGARSRLWSEIVCNVFNRPVAIPEPADASFGAALIAGTGIGLFPDPKAAVNACLHIGRRLEPDTAQATAYDTLFARYKAIHDALAPVYAAGVAESHA
jgi:xylulokinase